MAVTRWAVVVSNKISKYSTARNRIRRVLRARLDHWAREHANLALDGIVVVSRHTTNTSIYSNELNECLDIVARTYQNNPSGRRNPH